MKPHLSIVWLYHDLRLGDNEALTAAAHRGPVLPLYILDETDEDGGASRWWLHEALRILSRNFHQSGATLILRRGSPLNILRSLISQTGAQSVSWARRYEPVLVTRDAEIKAALEKEGVQVFVHTGFLLFEPEQITTQSGTPFKVYTPFSKACLAAPSPLRPLPAPRLQNAPDVTSDDLSNWKLVPAKAHWPHGLAHTWIVGEDAAGQRLHDFLSQSIVSYKELRDQPAIKGTSQLSPYLHFGHISPRQIWHAVMRAQSDMPSASSSIERYLLEILWREFSWHLLHHIPHFTSEPLQKSFNSFPWRQDQAGLKAWQQGQTGYPIIDAGMRQLWQSGWMHNRVRMITASFLIKDLLIDWRQGMAWFWDTLVDADLGSNTASWQWVAGCGADAAPYFRIFNPILQGQKFDPKGDYVRHFVPELAKLEAAYIHEPWNAPADVLAKAGIDLGKTYPKPIVDHSKARQRALNALKINKGEAVQASETLDLFD